jgi:ABC-type transporter Mla MlaB component
MLKITITEAPTEQRWVLQGRLTQPWVSELRLHWRKTHRARQGRACVVDLNDVTGIDQSGESVLLTMMREGAQFIASGVFTTHLLAVLAQQKTEMEDCDGHHGADS